MSIEIPISSKGQVVIPKDVRDALGLTAGQKLKMQFVGRQIILEAPSAPRERISFEEFQRRVPKYEGPTATIDDMNAAVDRMFADRQRQ